MSLRFYSFFV